MATKKEHVAKAENNAAFARSLELKSQVNVDWALIALFYSSVHYVDAYLEKIGILPHEHDTHGKREKQVMTNGKLRIVQREYFDLKNFSIISRYYCKTTKADKVTKEAMPALEAIKQHIQKSL